ncbi:MAG: hypothetical protein CVV49_00615 [Spirochaetae bacterium HGW-Spirochaetae-5]|nr:MAG: hypothetical protein CVV49_00615 [Spirochaetae bacterium HGW-Spirochaetae-5]
MSFSDMIFGGTKQASTLTPAQKSLLSQLGGLQQQYNPGTFAALSSIGRNPSSSYEYNADNGAAAFNSGVVNPALQKLNEQLGNSQHSSMLHSSANRQAQDKLKSDTLNNINNLQYQNVLNQQQLKQQGQDNAYSRQLNALASLMGGNQSVLGTQGTALQKTGGLLDFLSAGGTAAMGIGSLMAGM